MNARVTIAFGVLLVVGPGRALAQAPLGTEFTYQGRLDTATGPASGPHDLRFRLYDAAVGGAQIGPILCAENISVTDGLLTVSLDFGAQFAGQQRFLEIEVRPDTGLTCHESTNFIALTPRQALTIAPQAAYAMNADRLDGLDSTAFLQTVPVPLTLTGTSNNWMIKAENATTAAGAASIIGTSTGLTGSTYGVFAVANSNAGVGVFGRAAAGSGATSGVYGQNLSTTGYGVFGAATAASGLNYGVYGRTSSTSGHGVFGYASAPTGTTFGVFGQSDSPDGYAGFFVGGKNYFSGSLGIGTSSPDAKLQVTGGSDAEPGSGGYVVAGLTTSTNVAIDNNEIMARNNGATAALALNGDGGNVTLIQAGTGNVGIGTSSPAAKLDVDGAARADSIEVNGGAIRVLGAGAGTNTAAFIHRYTGDGTDSHSEINHPLCNGRPDALLFVTVRHPGSGLFFPPSTIHIDYGLSGTEHWFIRTDGEDLGVGTGFNVLIILP